MPRLLQELKRRKVFRVLVAYLVASWLSLQIADVLSSILSLPDWAPKLVLLLLAIGIVPALILAWAYELTPQGIQRDEDQRQQEASVTPRRLRDVMLAAGLILAIGAVAGPYWMSGANERCARDIALSQPDSARQKMGPLCFSGGEGGIERQLRCLAYGVCRPAKPVSVVASRPGMRLRRRARRTGSEVRNDTRPER